MSKSETRRLAHLDPGKLAEENAALKDQLRLAKAFLAAEAEKDVYARNTGTPSDTWARVYSMYLEARESFRAAISEGT